MWLSAVGAEWVMWGAQHLHGTQPCREMWDAWGAQHLHGTQCCREMWVGELPVNAASWSGPVWDLPCSSALERKAKQRRAARRRALVLTPLYLASFLSGLSSSTCWVLGLRLARCRCHCHWDGVYAQSWVCGWWIGHPSGAGSGQGYSATWLPTGHADRDLVHTITCKTRDCWLWSGWVTTSPLTVSGSKCDWSLEILGLEWHRSWTPGSSWLSLEQWCIGALTSAPLHVLFQYLTYAFTKTRPC